MTTSNLDGFHRMRCERNGCTAEVLLGHSRSGMPVVLDTRPERRAVLQRVVTKNLMGEPDGVGKRVVFFDTYLPHRLSCKARGPGGESEGDAVAAAENGGSAT